MGTGKDEMTGYEYLLGEESMGGSMGTKGIKIFARDSERDLVTIQERTGQRGLSKEDWGVVYDAAKVLKFGLWLNTAKKDPDGPKLAETYKHDTSRAFYDAGLDPIFMEFLPNGYCKEPCCYWKPWFKVTCEFGHVKLGWRKSVIHLDWVNTTIKNTGDEIFPDVNSTKGSRGDSSSEDKGRMIHCYGFKEVVEFLKDLRGWNRLILGTHYPKLPFGDYRDYAEED